MTLFHHHGGIDSQYITQFHIRQGDRAAGLSWRLRDRQPREVLIFQSARGFVDDDVDPTGDGRQQLVYQGTDLNARLSDTDLADDLAYYYSDDFTNYYSVFVRGDDGNLHLQLIAIATPRSVGSWQRPDFDTSESPQEIADVEIDRELAHLSRP
jgi:hypothetical protein